MELFAPDETAAIEQALIADGANLRALPLERLGFYGGRPRPLPVAIGNCFYDEDEDWDERYAGNEPRREADRRQAQLVAGALWRGCARLLEGLFDDLCELGDLEAAGGDVQDFIENESEVLHGLPPAFAQEYDSYFVRRFLVVAADMTTKLAGKWTPPSCVAQELAVRCLVGVTDAYLDEVDVDVERGWGSYVFDALVEDADYEFLYDITSVGRREALLRMSHVDTINLGFNSWFEPFGDRPLSAFVDPEPPARPQLQPSEYTVDPEAFPGEARQSALDSGELEDLSYYTDEGPFTCPLAITREAREATVAAAPDPDNEEQTEQETDSYYRIIAAAAAAVQEEPDRVSARFNVPAQDGNGVWLTLVAGPDDAGGQHLTVQLATP
ncbi:hypothetical protein Achl_4105 (plasmid) [Pseudarthrobacter chlorophenolicus A6]|uniref:Uncharacterized protein n=1 Tax=Pseudarthrobacter chlorophenolicus (strain ATCC 700700 / DSM 12829 / CIP 107037 / JCM 12360 / KCTC 9906 / NCIMB 13794 / A6) TaxID=452863 RepID=B8HI09_PSECP|nr:hypothetical protein [Pseudarthrobacter chlorophenolicus]ACL42056.1 hypothetical protein Achl_4105 [Pseudarthrobacter chlorophenolicus A6]SDQ20950.1 hypothetical protein SAMN04489738_0755 [Pseudarthrobacter chlorophenolicus]